MQWLFDIVQGMIDAAIAACHTWVLSLGYATQTWALEQLCTSAIRVSRSTTQPVPSGSWTVIYFNAVNWDINGEWIDYKFVPKEAGYFQVNVAAMGVNLVANTLFMAGIFKNGVKQAGSRFGVLLTDYQGTVMTDIVHCNGSTDYIEARVYQNSGSSKNLFADITATYMSIHQLSKDSWL